MSKTKFYSGRLVVDGDTGRLYGDDGKGIHNFDGSLRDIPEVAWSEEDQNYIFVDKGEAGHNERHSKSVADISVTSGPLFDDNGVKVFDGDPHHFKPQPGDPHYAEGEGRNRKGQITHTKLTFLSDDVAATTTGHTEAYVK